MFAFDALLPERAMSLTYGFTRIVTVYLVRFFETENRSTRFSGIISKKSPSFCMTPFSTRITNLTALQPQSRDYSCYVSRPIMRPPQL